MKRILSFILTIFLAIGMSISLGSCSCFYCNPKGKEWHNLASLPNISNPFNEVYDGSYSIQIEKNGEVLFKTLNGEEIKGTLSTSLDSKHTRTDIDITFENGTTASGECYINNSGRILTLFYNFTKYTFSDKQALSKEEFDLYRSQFIAFLTNVYETGTFPTQEEIETNNLYKQFTNYYQIDPHCGGPIVYDSLERATIENIKTTEQDKEISLNINGESIVCSFDTSILIASINNESITQLALSDITESECLVERYVDWYDGVETYHISKIFIMDNK